MTFLLNCLRTFLGSIAMTFFAESHTTLLSLAPRARLCLQHAASDTGPTSLEAWTFPMGCPSDNLPLRKLSRRGWTPDSPSTKSARILRGGCTLDRGRLIRKDAGASGGGGYLLHRSRVRGFITPLSPAPLRPPSTNPTSSRTLGGFSQLTLRCDHALVLRHWQKSWVPGAKAHLPLAGRRAEDGKPAPNLQSLTPVVLILHWLGPLSAPGEPRNWGSQGTVRAGYSPCHP